jgi:hypothetical protein
MRSTALLLVPLLVAPMAAQEFEGTVTMKMQNQGQGAADVTVYIKGDKAAYAIVLPSGPTAGQTMRLIMNGSTRKVTMLMPAMPGMPLPAGAKGVKMVSDMGPMGVADGDHDNVTVTPLGSSQTIAGAKCDDYRIEENGNQVHMCISTTLGSFRMPSMSGPGRQAPPPAWARAIGDKPMFPLKVWSDADGVAMEVTSISRGGVPASALDETAEGFVDMSSLMGGMRRNN